MLKFNWIKISAGAVVAVLFAGGLYYYSHYFIRPNQDNSQEVLAKLQETGDLVFDIADILQVKLPGSLSVLAETENAGEFATAAEITGDALKIMDEMAVKSAELKTKTAEFKILAEGAVDTETQTSALKTADILERLNSKFENLVDFERELLGLAKTYYEALAAKREPGVPDFFKVNAKIAAAGSNAADLINNFTASADELSMILNDKPAISKNEPSELKIEDVALGQNKEAKNGDTLVVHYIGTLQNGTKFDSSVDRGQPFTFVLGSGQVIKGWEQGLLGMKMGGHRRLTIPPELGYGARGQGGIPPNSTLIFEIDLLDIN